MAQMSEILPYLLAGVLLAFAVLHLGIWLSTRQMIGRSAPNVADLLGERLMPTGKTVLYFHNPDCSACVVMTPRVDRLAEQHPGVVKVNTREERELSKRLGVSATPTIIALEDGKIVAAMAGTQSERRLKKLFRESRRRGARPQA